MKSILYVGATLMIGASIYGFVDYKQTSNKKEFKNMYTEENISEPAPVVINEKKEPVANNEITVKTKNTVTKKQVTKEEDAIVSIKPIAEEDAIQTGAPAKIEEATVTIAPSKQTIVVRKRSKRFNTKLFSRAPLREDYEVIDVVKPAKETKKAEPKEQ